MNNFQYKTAQHENAQEKPRRYVKSRTWVPNLVEENILIVYVHNAILECAFPLALSPCNLPIQIHNLNEVATKDNDISTQQNSSQQRLRLNCSWGKDSNNGFYLQKQCPIIKSIYNL